MTGSATPTTRVGPRLSRAARGIARETADKPVQLCLKAIEANVATVDEAVYSALEDEARSRSVRDPYHWPLVACALALDAGV
jgi:hypothetical protein